MSPSSVDTKYVSSDICTGITQKLSETIVSWTPSGDPGWSSECRLAGFSQGSDTPANLATTDSIQSCCFTDGKWKFWVVKTLVSRDSVT